jgi:hypothetical protein
MTFPMQRSKHQRCDESIRSASPPLKPAAQKRKLLQRPSMEAGLEEFATR